MDKNRTELLEERERLEAQREKLQRPGRNIFEVAAARGRATPLRPGSMEDKTRIMDEKYVAPGQGDKDAAAAWDSRMNYLDSRIEDINTQLRAPTKKAKGGSTKAYAKGGKVRGSGIEQRGKTKGKFV